MRLNLSPRTNRNHETVYPEVHSIGGYEDETQTWQPGAVTCTLSRSDETPYHYKHCRGRGRGQSAALSVELRPWAPCDQECVTGRKIDHSRIFLPFKKKTKKHYYYFCVVGAADMSERAEIRGPASRRRRTTIHGGGNGAPGVNKQANGSKQQDLVDKPPPCPARAKADDASQRDSQYNGRADTPRQTVLLGQHEAVNTPKNPRSQGGPVEEIQKRLR